MIGQKRFGRRLAAAMLVGLWPGSVLARDLTEPPPDLSVAAPDPAPKASRPIVKNKKRAKSAAQTNSEPEPAASAQPAIHRKDAVAGEDPVSFGMKWNGTNESFGAATSLREINQTINGAAGVSAQPVGAGAEVGVKYKF